MSQQLKLLVGSLLGGILCMILHEFPKAFVYQHDRRKKIQKQDKNQVPPIKNLLHFIDPIGLIFCMIFRIGFSKPYYYRMQDKKLNAKLGMVGLLSLFLQFLLICSYLKFGLHLDSNLIVPVGSPIWYEFFIYFLSSYAIICIGMFVTNLFPLLSMDMAWMITASKPMTFVSLVKSDFIIKMIWILLVVLRVTPSICWSVFRVFMGV